MTGDEKKKGDEKTELPTEKDKLQPAATEYKFAVRPVKRPGLDGFLNFLWNKETGEVMGRTGTSWLKITIFYIIYYTCLAGFFAICLSVFLVSLPDGKPTWEVEESIIGDNPGVGYRPHPPDDKIQSTLIWFRHGYDSGNWNDTDGWVERLETDLEPYLNTTYQYQPRTDGMTFTDCGVLGSSRRGNGQLCRVNRDELFKGRCNHEDNYGYADGKPCILIKLNKIYNWEPAPYKTEDEMPDNIPDFIRQEFRKNLESNPDLNERVWLDCHGENPGDRENLGAINYYPYSGFSANFYPYRNEDGYLSPVVFAELLKPELGVMISIECRAWDKYITHDSVERRGLVHFELMID